MKKKIVLLVAAALMVAGLAAFAVAGEQKWSCSRYYNGNYEGYMTVWASSHSEAMAKAVEFYKSYTYTSIKCE